MQSLSGNGYRRDLFRVSPSPSLSPIQPTNPFITVARKLVEPPGPAQRDSPCRPPAPPYVITAHPFSGSEIAGHLTVGLSRSRSCLNVQRAHANFSSLVMSAGPI